MSHRVLLLAALLAVALLALEVAWLDRRLGKGRVSRAALAFWSVANVAFVAYLWFNHAPFPLHLEIMEGTVLQHLQRAASLQPVYPAPTPDFVPLAYNPLYYYLTVPFTWVFGVNVLALRLVAILGMLGCGIAVFAAVRQKTGSTWWGLVATGFFAAAYRVMDSYLDNAHSDSWFLCTALWGSFLLSRKRSRLSDAAGLLLLVASFWFKQHGAVFAVGGVLYLTWRHGLRRSWPFWLIAVAAGPVAYLGLGPWLFGSHFHYFTWEVPSAWTTFNRATVTRCVKLVLSSYPLLALSGGIFAAISILREGREVSVWSIQLFFAAATGVMGALDPGSLDNVFIAMGTWFIVVGTLGLHRMSQAFRGTERWGVDRLALAMSFLFLLYDPREVRTSPNARRAYEDLIAFLTGLHGSVYAPSVGQLESGYTLQPAAHWVGLEDMVRGPGRTVRNQPQIRRLLEGCLHPDGPAYLLTHFPLRGLPVIEFLGETYVLETDLGDRFEPLRVLPKRFDHGWPRYLYRYAPKNETSAGGPAS